MFVMLLKPETELKLQTLKSLHAYLNRQVGVLSQLLD